MPILPGGHKVQAILILLRCLSMHSFWIMEDFFQSREVAVVSQELLNKG